MTRVRNVNVLLFVLSIHYNILMFYLITNSRIFNNGYVGIEQNITTLAG